MGLGFLNTYVQLPDMINYTQMVCLSIYLKFHFISFILIILRNLEFFLNTSISKLFNILKS